MSLIDKKTKTSGKYPIAKVNSKNIYVDMDPSIDEDETVSEYKGKDIQPLPFIMDDDQRFSCFISAPSGGGKSMHSSYLVKQLLKMKKYKDNLPVLLTLNQDSDKAYNGIDMHKLDPYDESIYEKPNTFWENIILVADDWESGPTEVVKLMVGLINMCLQRGRKLNIAVIVCTHVTQNYNLTRQIIYECETYVLFGSANRNSVLKFAKSYLDMDTKELKAFKKIMGNHRSITIHKAVPRYIITKNLIKIMN